MNKCQVCNGKIVSQCRCAYNHQLCENEHKTSVCLAHKERPRVVVEKFEHGKNTGCICNNMNENEEIKALKLPKSGGVLKGKVLKLKNGAKSTVTNKLGTHIVSVTAVNNSMMQIDIIAGKVAKSFKVNSGGMISMNSNTELRSQAQDNQPKAAKIGASLQDVRKGQGNIVLQVKGSGVSYVNMGNTVGVNIDLVADKNINITVGGGNKETLISVIGSNIKKNQSQTVEKDKSTQASVTVNESLAHLGEVKPAQKPEDSMKAYMLKMAGVKPIVESKQETVSGKVFYNVSDGRYYNSSKEDLFIESSDQWKTVLTNKNGSLYNLSESQIISIHHIGDIEEYR